MPPVRRSGPPVGRAFVAFIVVIIVMLLVALAEAADTIDLPEAAAPLGMVATTVFVIAGSIAAYRALVTRARSIGVIAAVLIGPGGFWSYWVFVRGPATGPSVTSMVVLIAAGLAAALFAQGLRFAHWLEVFSGLGSLGLALVAVVIRIEPASAAAMSPALLAAVSGMTCLYGLLVDVELAEHRTLLELTQSKRRTEDEVRRAEDVLHDLRSGLLAIEAAIGSMSGELAGPLCLEAARLRRLAANRSRIAGVFDLVPPIENLVAARRAAGLNVSVVTPRSVLIAAESSEILAIVDNLIANAQRHGCPPIVVEIVQETGSTVVAVHDRGTGPIGLSTADIFKRRVTTHPDGQGLGLSRARLLAQQNGAELDLVPSIDGSTTFVLRLLSESRVDAS